MLINPMTPLDSAAVGMRQGTAGSPLTSQTDVIEALHGLLVHVGWTVTNMYATGGIAYPLGFPLSSGLFTTPTVVHCSGAYLDSGALVVLDGIPYRAYDPGTQTPSSDGSCVFFALDTSEDGGLNNLCTAIDTSPRFNATWARNGSGVAIVTLTAKLPGPAANGAQLHTNTYSGVSGPIEGGGYIFTSAVQAQTSQFSVKVTSYGNINGQTRHATQPIHFDLKTPYNSYGSAIFSLDSATSTSSARQYLGAAGYTIVANPYSFAVFLPDPPTSTSSASVFFCAPYVPIEDGFSSCYAVFVGYPVVAGVTFWRDGATCLDAAPQLLTVNSFARVLALRQPGAAPLKTPSGAALIIGAPYVMFGRTSADTPAVVGRLWDTALVHDVVDEGLVIEGKRYITLGSQDGAAGRSQSSLVFRIDD